MEKKESNQTNALFLSINETAAKTGLSRTFIRQLCKDGKAPSLRIGSGRNAVYKINYPRFVELISALSEETKNG